MPKLSSAAIPSAGCNVAQEVPSIQATIGGAGGGQLDQNVPTTQPTTQPTTGGAGGGRAAKKVPTKQPTAQHASCADTRPSSGSGGFSSKAKTTMQTRKGSSVLMSIQQRHLHSVKLMGVLSWWVVWANTAWFAHSTGSDPATASLTPTPPKKPAHRLTRKRALDEDAIDRALNVDGMQEIDESDKSPKKAKLEVKNDDEAKLEMKNDDDNLAKACFMYHAINQDHQSPPTLYHQNP